MVVWLPILILVLFGIVFDAIDASVNSDAVVDIAVCPQSEILQQKSHSCNTEVSKVPDSKERLQ